jgi:hypothetical protein
MATSFYALAFNIERSKGLKLLGFMGRNGTVVQDESEAHRFPTFNAAVSACEDVRIPPGAGGVQVFEVVLV